MSQDTDPAVITSLQRIVELEMAGVVRFAHYALMVTGPHRIPIVEFLIKRSPLDKGLVGPVHPVGEVDLLAAL